MGAESLKNGTSCQVLSVKLVNGAAVWDTPYWMASGGEQEVSIVLTLKPTAKWKLVCQDKNCNETKAKDVSRVPVSRIFSKNFWGLPKICPRVGLAAPLSRGHHLRNAQICQCNLDHFTALSWCHSYQNIVWFTQVWSLTQFYSVDFSQSRIGVKKCVFNKRTIKVFSCF